MNEPRFEPGDRVVTSDGMTFAVCQVNVLDRDEPTERFEYDLEQDQVTGWKFWKRLSVPEDDLVYCQASLF